MITDDRREFWIVWSPQGTTPPQVRHYSYGDAAHAAKQMATKHPEAQFFICHAQADAAAKRPLVMPLHEKEQQSDIPF